MPKSRIPTLLVLGAAAALAACSPFADPPAGGVLPGGGSPQSMPQSSNSLPAGAANSSTGTPTE